MDRFGQVHEVYKLDGYKLHHDYVLDDNGDLVPAQEEHRQLTDDMEKNETDRKIDIIQKSLIGLNSKDSKDVLDLYLSLEYENIDLQEMLEFLDDFSDSPLRDVVLKNLERFYITDAGFCGTSDGVIGMEYKTSLNRLTTGLPERYDVAEGKNEQVNAVEVELAPSTGCAISIKRIFCSRDKIEEDGSQ